MKIAKLLKRWTQMVSGKSAFNVKQGVGKYYKKDEIGGYYNDLTGKVEATKNFDDAEIPINKTVSGLTAHFPITIFQYALGLYDKFLETEDYSYLTKFMDIADWAVDTQKENGMWDCMSSLGDKAHKTQSSMCQGEGISVLARAYTQTHESMFKTAIIKAADFMLKETTEGGTATSKRDGLVLQEYVSRYNLSVLNGWIFSIFGLKDALLVTGDKKYELALDQNVSTLKRMLSKYDRGYWSSYDMKGTIASPAYHDLHIELLKVMEDLFDEKVFGIYAKKFSQYQQNSSNRNKAIRQKLRQKLSKNNYYDLNTSLVD